MASVLICLVVVILVVICAVIAGALDFVRFIATVVVLSLQGRLRCRVCSEVE